MHRALTYFRSIFNEIIMIILDISTWYDLFGLYCSKGKNLQVPLRCFLMLWPLLGSGLDDRALANDEWISLFPSTKVIHFECYTSIIKPSSFTRWACQLRDKSCRNLNKHGLLNRVVMPQLRMLGGGWISRFLWFELKKI